MDSVLPSSFLPVLVSLLSVAFLGSWHCGAMCGPIAAAIGRERSLVYYHLGRLIAYVTVGAIAGQIGSELSSIHNRGLKIVGFLCLAALLLLSASTRNLLSSPLKRCPKLLANGSWISQFIFGVSSVLMPCGWLWSFVAASAATSSALAGALVMTSLWLSSVPALSLASAYFRASLRRLTPQKRIWVNWVLVGSGFTL